MKVNELGLRCSSFSTSVAEWDKLTPGQQGAMALAAFATDELMGTTVEVTWPSSQE